MIASMTEVPTRLPTASFDAVVQNGLLWWGLIPRIEEVASHYLPCQSALLKKHHLQCFVEILWIAWLNLVSDLLIIWKISAIKQIRWLRFRHETRKNLHLKNFAELAARAFLKMHSSEAMRWVLRSLSHADWQSFISKYKAHKLRYQNRSCTAHAIQKALVALRTVNNAKQELGTCDLIKSLSVIAYAVINLVTWSWILRFQRWSGPANVTYGRLVGQTLTKKFWGILRIFFVFNIFSSWVSECCSCVLFGFIWLQLGNVLGL